MIDTVNKQAFLDTIGYAERDNRFYVTFDSLDDEDSGDESVTYTIISTTTPSKQIGSVQIFWQGRPIKLPGDLTFSDWECTMYADGSGKSRKKIEKWSNYAIDTITNKRGSLSLVKKNIEINLLDENGLVTCIYKLKGAFPTNVGGSTKNQESSNTASKFSVTWVYDEYEAVFATPTV